MDHQQFEVRLARIETHLLYIKEIIDGGHTCTQGKVIATLQNETAWLRRTVIGGFSLLISLSLWLNQKAIAEVFAAIVIPGMLG